MKMSLALLLVCALLYLIPALAADSGTEEDRVEAVGPCAQRDSEYPRGHSAGPAR